jgi:hypothetical protein
VTSTAETRVVFRPVKLARVCRGAAVVLIVVFTIVAFSLRQGSGAEIFQLADQVAMVMFGVLGAGAVLLLTRARVEADATAIRVRNVIGDKVLPWQVVRGIRLDDGASWATLDLHDDDTVALLAVQSNDKERAVRAVLELRRLLAASRAG